MIGVFSGIKSGLTLSSSKSLFKPRLEGLNSWLHFRVTVIMLFGFSVMLTCFDWIGDGNRIACTQKGHEEDWKIRQSKLNTYCYIIGTYTLPEHYLSDTGPEVPFKGVGYFNPHDSVKSYKSYYQWVPYLLFIQGLLFYAPHYFFKVCEGGKVNGILSQRGQIVLNKSDRARRHVILADYVYDSLNTHNVWALKMLFVEVWYLLNVVANIIFIDRFLGGEFSTYGYDAIRFSQENQENRIDPMGTIFPRVTKCVYYLYGPSGSMENYDAICVLPMNILNEKVFVVLWLWFIYLAVVSVISLILSSLNFVAPWATKAYLKSLTLKKNQHTHLEAIGEKCQLGDWRLLYLLGKNMEPLFFEEFLFHLYSLIVAKSIDEEIK